jgi:hypothetical protein
MVEGSNYTLITPSTRATSKMVISRERGDLPGVTEKFTMGNGPEARSTGVVSGEVPANSHSSHILVSGLMGK